MRDARIDEATRQLVLRVYGPDIPVASEANLSPIVVANNRVGLLGRSERPQEFVVRIKCHQQWCVSGYAKFGQERTSAY